MDSPSSSSSIGISLEDNVNGSLKWWSDMKMKWGEDMMITSVIWVMKMEYDGGGENGVWSRVEDEDEVWDTWSGEENGWWINFNLFCVMNQF